MRRVSGPPGEATPLRLSAALRDHWVLAMIAAGLIVRVALAVLLDGEMTPRGDERLYLNKASDFLRTGSLETGAFVRPPLYFAFLAFTEAVAGEASVLVARLVQCVASCATALPVYRSASRIGGRRSARLAVALLLFDPTLIAFSHLLWPETLFTLAVAIVFDGVVGLGPGHVRRAVALGAVTGLAMLLKPVFGLFTLLLAVSWVQRLGLVSAVRLALVFGGTAAVVISPWVVRNQLRYGGSVVLENQGGYNLWSGNAKQSPKLILDAWGKIKGGPGARNQVAAERGVRAIRDDPGRFARSYARRASNFFGFEYFAVRHLAMGGYPDVSRGALLVCFYVIQIGWALALLSAALGLGPTLRDPTLRLVALYGLAFVLLVSAMVVTTRFRVPFVFVTAVAGGVGLDRLFSGRLGWRSAVLALVAASLLAVSASRPIFLKHFTGDFATRTDLLTSDWVFFRY